LPLIFEEISSTCGSYGECVCQIVATVAEHATANHAPAKKHEVSLLSSGADANKLVALQNAAPKFGLFMYMLFML